MAVKTLFASEGILVWLEMAGGRLSRLSLELAAQARRLAGGAGLPAWGLVIEEEEVNPLELRGVSLDAVFTHRTAWRGFKAREFAGALLAAIELCRPSAVLIGATDRGKDVAPLAAAKLGAGLTADCLELRLADGDNLLQIRPAFGGNVMAEILTPLARPQFATVRAGAFQAVPESSTAAAPRVVPLSVPVPAPSGLQVLESVRQNHVSSLEEAPLIVVVGRGFKSAADLEPVRAFAEARGAELGGTRAVVERGWLPPEAQIGLSGRQVSPALLITLGVSGSVQFLAGICGARRIVAVNSDPAAPIFSVADVRLCADLYQILPFLEQQGHR